MTRSLPLARVLAFGAALGLVGCVKVDDEVTVKSDGSGSYTETTVIDMGAAAQIGDLMKGFGGGGGGGGGFGGPPGFGGGPGMMGGDGQPPPGAPPEHGAPPEGGAKPTDAPQLPADPIERIKARWKDIPGLEVTKTTSEPKDGKTNLHVEATFKTLEAYAQASSIDMGSTLVKNADGSYTLKFEGRFGMGRGGRSEATPPGAPGMEGGAPAGMESPPIGMDVAPAGMDGAPAVPAGGPGAHVGLGGMGAMMMPMLEPWMKGLSYDRKLTLPGTIVETNGTKGEDGSTVSWRLTFDDIKNGKVEAQTVTFKGEGLELKPFTVKRSARRGLMGGGALPRPPKDAPPGTPATPPGGAPPGSGEK